MNCDGTLVHEKFVVMGAMNTVSDGIAVRRKAFARLAHEQEGALLRSARRLCMGDVDRAMDLAQETLIRAYQAYVDGRYEDENNARAWLLRIMTNIFINEYRRRQKWEANVGLEDLTDPAKRDFLQTAPDDLPGARLLKMTLDEDLERALG